MRVGRTSGAGVPAPVRWVVAAGSAAATADFFVMYAVLWFAGPRGWSGAQIAVLVVAARAPSLVGGVLGGRGIDRFGPRALMGLDAVVRTAAMLGLVVAGRVGGSGTAGYLAVLVLAGVSGAAAPVSYSAARTLLPRLVTADRLGRANALLGVGEQVPLIVAAALVGPALLLLGNGLAFVVPAVLMVFVGAVASRLPETSAEDGVGVRDDGDPEPVGTADVSPWRSVAVLTLLGLSTVYFLVYGPFQPVLPFLVRDNLGGDAETFGLLRVVSGVGGLLGLALAPWLSSFGRPGMVNALGAVAWGAVTLPLVLLHDVGPALAVYFVSGLVWGPYPAVEATALQRWTPRSHHGRVFGTQRALISTALPLGAAAGGLALDHVSAAVILAVSCLACSVAGALALAVPAIRRGAPVLVSQRRGG